MTYEVTIGIPVYQIEKFIRRAMEAVLAQTFQSIEFLVIDDCGTDRSIAIVTEYQQTHPRGKDIRIVRQPHNMGLGMGRNRMIDEAKGRYLYFMDGDDAIAPNTIELLYNAAQRYQAELVYGSFERIEQLGSEEKHLPTHYPSRQFLKENEYALWVYRKYEGIQAMVWNILFDIDVYRKNGLRHQPITYWEDFTFTMDLPTYVTRVVLLPDITYYYYCREGSASNFQKRSHIEKGEIETTVNAMMAVKGNSQRIKQKPYFPLRMLKVMTTCFYIVCNILHNAAIVSPPFSNSELRHIMQSPITLCDVLRFRMARLQNLVLYIMGALPPSLSVWLMRQIGRKKGQI